MLWNNFSVTCMYNKVISICRDLCIIMITHFNINLLLYLQKFWPTTPNGHKMTLLLNSLWFRGCSAVCHNVCAKPGWKWRWIPIEGNCTIIELWWWSCFTYFRMCFQTYLYPNKGRWTSPCRWVSRSLDKLQYICLKS